MTTQDNITRIIKPQPGPQEQFFSTKSDICIYGGAAGGGKTWSLLYEPLRHLNNPRFNAVIFRQTYPMIERPGGLWDKAKELYPLHPIRGRGVGGRLWRFPSGMYVRFSHMGDDQDAIGWQGTEVPLFEFDELTHFSEFQFFYMLTRNRSMSGVKPYIRATCNPDADSWVAKFVDWWIAEDGYADWSRAGKIRYMVRVNDFIHWADNPNELRRRFPELPHDAPKSVTFIPSTLYDNKILMETNPGYLANLLAQGTVERERLLGDKRRGGNWRIRLQSGMIWKYEYFARRYRRDELPQFTKIIQSIDTAFKTGVHNDYSVIATWGTEGVNYYLLDLWRAKVEYGDLKQAILDNYAKWKPDAVLIEDAAAGQSIIQELENTTALPVIRVSPAGTGKVAWAESVSPLGRAKKIFLPDTEAHPEEGEWVAEWIKEHVNFPSTGSEAHDDMVDTTSKALRYLRENMVSTYRVVNLLSDAPDDPLEAAEPLAGANEYFSNLLIYWNGDFPPSLNGVNAVDYLVQSKNPAYLDAVAQSYQAVLLTDGSSWFSTEYLKEDGYYILRCYSDPAYAANSIEKQGYGRVIKLRDVQPADMPLLNERGFE